MNCFKLETLLELPASLNLPIDLVIVAGLTISDSTYWSSPLLFRKLYLFSIYSPILELLSDEASLGAKSFSFI